ncbi:RNA polymerase sigma-70 factor [Massilibacteroides vaginae]|uniref:RNA polymerase sigma-70 factor n=1 Tax=Massilibacteroides vaginae TaxID=1673718 RepID=UPI000A1CDC8E|nr:RNA polymerase sigma-70 factor [Massilibacteroides vaginae]
MTKQNTIIYTDSLKDNFDKIYVLYYSRMHRFAKEYVLSDEDAENIVQDVFLLLWERKDVLDIRISLVSYLFSLVKNKCLDFIRHQHVVDAYKNDLSLKLSALELLNYTLSSEEDIERIVINAVERLPERCRLIFLKSRVEGKKYKEIAEELGISVNTVENQMSIALKKLRIELKDFLPLLAFLINC